MNNTSVYNAAYVGGIGGAILRGHMPTNHTGVIREAQAFATAVDALIAPGFSGDPSLLIVVSHFAFRPGKKSYAGLAAQVVATYNATIGGLA